MTADNHPSRPGVGICCALMLWAFLLTVQTASAQQLVPVSLRGFDVLARPGETVHLKAHLAEPLPGGFFRNVGEGQITFTLENRAIGTATTDNSGTAALERIFPDVGNFIIRISYSGNESYSPVDSYLRVFICKPSATFLVTGIDGILARTRSRLDLYSGRYNPLPFLRAPIVLRRLVSRNDLVVIYLTGREQTLTNMTRDWLLERGFPPGPIFFRDLQDNPFFPTQAKIDRLEKLKSRWPGLLWGIAAEKDVVEAMARLKMETFWFSSEPTNEIPSIVQPVSDWRLIETALIPESTLER